ncbi:MAG: ABC-F family ATP-binding cassette domain-containing protein [Bacteroidales bacterium]|nr:ABC-F family ATP-binding cassette domain-containing protein [Bacteroidales bacterium]
MISIGGVTVSFGGTSLLDNISFHIGENDKIGLVGKNGAGKSTLMKLIVGEQQPSSGHIEMPSDISIGYLPQIMMHSRGKTVMEEALTAFSHIHRMEAEIESVSSALASRTDYESSEYEALINRFNTLNDRLSLEGGEAPEVRAAKTLFGLGFREEDFGRPTETFSQGWNMRIELAKILLSSPDVLLLDEPTNHLDIESIAWFEDYLKAFRGAVLLVSHDRRFLDRVTSRTVEIMLGHIYDYKVPYTRYLSLREERMASQNAAYENQRRMIEKTEEFINRFRYKPTKSNQVQSRIKALEKLEIIEIDQTDNSALTLRFPKAPRSGDVPFMGRDLTAAYPGKTVFTHADIEIRRGEKVALVGRNGEGKTTLMKLITGQLEPSAGEARLGHNVNIGYYAQNQEDILDGNDTVYGTLEKIAVGDVRMRLRDILGAFLFRGEDIDKKVCVLSGGERARLGMAKLMLQPFNLLALDEPTNHMDIRSKDVLKQALARYDGTLVVVSHDRDFLEGLVDKMYEFRDGKVREFLGSVDEFLESRKIENLKELEQRFKEPIEHKEVKSQEKVQAGMRYDKIKARSREDRKVRNRIAWLEDMIGKNEERMHEIEKILANPLPNDDILDLTREYLNAKRDVDDWTLEWSELSESIDN